MTARFKPEVLTCPEPSSCTVAVAELSSLAQSGKLPVTTIDAGTTWNRVYDSRFGHMEFNPGFGNARFSPFDSAVDGKRIATIYLAGTMEAALLEGALRDVDLVGVPEADEESFQGLLHIELTPQESFTVVDLRDRQLAALGLGREAVSSSASQHYPCTRTIAKAIHGSMPDAGGILWHSRQVEVNGLPQSKVLVLFEERLSAGRAAFKRSDGRGTVGSLYEGDGRAELDRVLERLGVSVADYW